MTMKITIQEMKGENKSSMGMVFAEYTHNLPTRIVECPENWIKTEPKTVFYTRIGGYQTTHEVLAYNYRENERVISIEMWVK